MESYESAKREIIEFLQGQPDHVHISRLFEWYEDVDPWWLAVVLVSMMGEGLIVIDGRDGSIIYTEVDNPKLRKLRDEA